MRPKYFLRKSIVILRKLMKMKSESGKNGFDMKRQNHLHKKIQLPLIWVMMIIPKRSKLEKASLPKKPKGVNTMWDFKFSNGVGKKVKERVVLIYSPWYHSLIQSSFFPNCHPQGIWKKEIMKNESPMELNQSTQKVGSIVPIGNKRCANEF